MLLQSDDAGETATTETRVGAGFGWVNPQNVETATDADYAQVTSSVAAYSNWLQAMDFSELAVPVGARIDGIEFTFRFDENAENLDGWRVNEVRPVKGGTIGSSNFATVPGVVAVPGTWATFSGGGPDELGGETWTAADVNGIGFGVAIGASRDPEDLGSAHLRCSQIAATVYFTPAATSSAFIIG